MYELVERKQRGDRCHQDLQGLPPKLGFHARGQGYPARDGFRDVPGLRRCCSSRIRSTSTLIFG